MRLRTRVEGGGTPRLTRSLKVYDPDVSMIGNGGGAAHSMCQALKRDPIDGR